MTCKTLQRKLKSEQHEPNQKPEVKSDARKGKNLSSTGDTRINIIQTIIKPHRKRTTHKHNRCFLFNFLCHCTWVFFFIFLFFFFIFILFHDRIEDDKFISIYRIYHIMTWLFSIIAWKCMIRSIFDLTHILSEWLVFNANSAIFQLYHGENKVIFNDMMTRSALY